MVRIFIDRTRSNVGVTGDVARKHRFPEGVSQHLSCGEEWVYEKQQEDIVFLGMGNPLLDMSVVCDDAELNKWGAKLGDAMLADPDKHGPMYKDLVAKYDVEYIAGGATQNSIRVAATLLKNTSVNCGYIGCIGKDAFGAQLKKSVSEAGVRAFYLEDEKTPTGTLLFLEECFKSHSLTQKYTRYVRCTHQGFRKITCCESCCSKQLQA